jgi:TPR repeat protein
MRRLLLVLAACVGLAGTAAAQATAQGVVTAIHAYNRGDVATAFRLLKAASDAGDPDAQVNLGYLYARGHGVAENQQEALRLYLLSAKRGNAEGMNAVAYKYLHGSGVAVDRPRAVHWFCRAAVLGDPRGLNNLGLVYYEGMGVTRDVGEARRLWRQAAERGNPNAMANLGRALFGPEAPIDRQEGTAWIVKAAQKGHAGAQQAARQLGFNGPLPPPVNTELEMRVPAKDLPPGKVRDCGVLVSKLGGRFHPG